MFADLMLHLGTDSSYVTTVKGSQDNEMDQGDKDFTEKGFT